MTLKINLKNFENKILWLITLFMFSSLYIFSAQSWGRYVLALSSVMIFIIGVILHDGFTYKININMYHIIQCVICVYCLFSCIWAINPSGALSRTYAMLQFLIFFSMIMAYFIKSHSIEPLLNIVMWSGYIVSIYTFIYYGGVSAIFNMLINAQRLENDFCNVNLIGMICAVACIIQIYKILYLKSFWSAIFMVPAIIILAACQSRKSIFMLILGIIAIIFLKNADNKNFLKSLFKIFTSLLILYFAFKFLMSLDIFSGMNHRLAGFLSNLKMEEANLNSSTGVRMNYIDIGLDYFYKKPFLGYGFASSNIILVREASDNTYFHNNFIELLVNGGIVGFLLYYFNYIYLFYFLIKYRKYSIKETNICLVILFILLVMDFGMVSFSNKTQYFYFIISYIQVNILKRERNKLLYENNNHL